ncbi:hypothetical protein G9E11_19850 [Arthrobacter sp. IA7]|uniref:hypothetical protein n=1 Tax=Arthrobacter ipis TaxID=2716202 RepID=UPI001687E092|nr:hypothetical protein [Arthrobacter ipis]MBD1544451.1 hypothetical protein [Arthrobacter ipis]
MLRKCSSAGSAICIAVLVMGLNLAACSLEPTADIEPAASSLAVAHLIVTDWRNGDDAMLAQYSGVLIKQSDGCVGLGVPAGSKSRPILLRWPAGTSLAEDGKAVLGLSGKRFAFDTVVGLGGGFGHVTVPPDCDSSMWGSVYDVQQPL